ncbi:glycosyltransferase [Sinorhizobium phage phiM7]|uniref:Glycosyl transferase-family protein n=2 Tax=Emdodecavirus TaxID=1980937 RepID=S5MB86_9CAUD|nr:glycosyltransferase [Sinorhizobium phage phiM12]YP_009601310.1 glycosyltransferase [Sinorhizobium phage phiM7]AGR47888.1 glycosyl transferase-family protein [Sinorhizobium phage phiM12]AKF12730.1 glycosyltransferase [Sinorhizobium phage phiM7]AKF13090.1 glycosyltransferase-family protein [Sinorhizobium phage phiM19]
MVEIIDGRLHRDELTKNARGGTELLADRLLNVVRAELLGKVQIIFSRPDKLLDGYRKILYIHDLPGDPALSNIRSEDYRKQFDLIVFVSHYQRSMFGKHYGFELTDRMVVIPNCIEPIPHKERSTDKLRLIYHTTPHRGLQILYPVFDHLSKLYPGKLELKVFSSFDIYGWSERDKPYEALFDAMTAHPDITYSKSVSNRQIRYELQQAHIFAFPSIWEETSCMALMEAMSANLTCVHSDLGALPETSHGATIMYPFVSDINRHANSFFNVLNAAILGFDHDEMNQTKVGKFMIDNYHNLNRFKGLWEGYLENLK